MKIQTLTNAGSHVFPSGEFWAALVANASKDSWLEAECTEVSEVIAPGIAADGPSAVFANQQPT